jgi:hypothetical protein
MLDAGEDVTRTPAQQILRDTQPAPHPLRHRAPQETLQPHIIQKPRNARKMAGYGVHCTGQMRTACLGLKKKAVTPQGVQHAQWLHCCIGGHAIDRPDIGTNGVSCHVGGRPGLSMTDDLVTRLLHKPRQPNGSPLCSNASRSATVVARGRGMETPE